MGQLVKYLLLFLGLFLCQLIAANNKLQGSQIDSLLALLRKDKQDTTQVDCLNKVSREYIRINEYDSSIVFATAALKLSGQLNPPYKKGIVTAYNLLGNIHREQSNFPLALDFFFKALKIDEETGDKSGMAKRLGNIGIVYKEEADYPKALDYYFKALKIKEVLGDENGIATQLGNLGIVYVNLGDYAKALDYYFKALKIDEKLGNKAGVARHLGNIGIVYRIQTHYLQSLECYEKALKIKEELGNKYEIASTLSNIGIVYDEQAEDLPDPARRSEFNAKALTYYLKALKLAEEIGYKQLEANTLGNIGSLYVETRKYGDAYIYLYRALAVSDGIGARDNVKSWYQLLSSLYEKSSVNLPDSIGGRMLTRDQMRVRALYYHKRYIAVRDMLFSEENKKQLVRKEMNFEFEKKEAATRAEQDKKDAVALAETKKHKIILFLVSFVLLLVAVAAIMIFRSLRITRKQKKLIERQKEFVEEKQKEILDSIYYARRIQTALITNEVYIQKTLSRLQQ